MEIEDQGIKLIVGGLMGLHVDCCQLLLKEINFTVNLRVIFVQPLNYHDQM
jgi:hypothetical protein